LRSRPASLVEASRDECDPKYLKAVIQ